MLDVRCISAVVAKGFGEAHPQNPKVVSDMTALHHIHEAGILYNLGERSKLKDQRPYTFMVSYTLLQTGMARQIACLARRSTRLTFWVL